MIRDMELLPDMSVYDKVYGILKTEPVDGRHIQELLGEHCKKQQLLPEESRMKEILSYRDYSYMRKRWEKYLRHRKRKEPAWTEVMQVLEQFLPQMWSTLCRDEIFFGRLDAGSAAVLRLVKCSEGDGAPDSSHPWYPDGKTEDLPEYRSLWSLLRASDRTRCISRAVYRK